MRLKRLGRRERAKREERRGRKLTSQHKILLARWKGEVAVLIGLLVLSGVLCVLGDHVQLVLGVLEGLATLDDWRWGSRNLCRGCGGVVLEVGGGDVEGLIIGEGRHLECDVGCWL